MSNKSAWTGDRPHIDESELRCKTGCGFYGNPAWDGHCSKCYKELVNKRQQRKTVFDPANIKNKVSRSVSDVSEFQSKASSMMSRKFDKFEEKRKQQLDQKTKAVKSIFRKSQSSRGTENPRLARPLSAESQLIVSDLQGFFKTISVDASQVVSKHIKAFMAKIVRLLEVSTVDELGEQVHDFYNNLSNTVSTHPAFIDFTQEQVDKLNELTERYITTRLYKPFINGVNAYSEDKDLAIQTRIRSLMWVSTSHLECKVNEEDPDVRVIMDNIITDLIEINGKRVPLDKLQLLVSASHQVLNLLKQSSGGIPASADDFLPALIYCVLKANPPLLQSNLCYITNFAQQNCLMSGEAGYFFTNLCCAVSFIEKLTADSLGLTQHEFDRYMSGDALPPNALDGTYMCEGIRTMQENIDHLTDMESTVNKLMDDYEKIVVEMDHFKEKLIQDVDDVLEKNPLTIRSTKRANIDEHDPAQEFLPPPMMPQSIRSENTSSPSDFHVDSEILTPSTFLEGAYSDRTLADSSQADCFGGDYGMGKKFESLTSSGTSRLSSNESLNSQIHFGGPFKQNSMVDPFLHCDPFTSLSSVDSSNLSLPLLSEEYKSLGSETDSDFASCVGSQSNPLYECSNLPFHANVPANTTFGSSSSSRPSTYRGLPTGSGNINFNCNSQSLDRSQMMNPLTYTGFSVQGGRIPSIPCDTGVAHSMRPMMVRARTPDPLSPPLEGPPCVLPPPLVPISAADPIKTDSNKDKMVDLLGDIVDTFDRLS